jgi:hypothetical protein
MNYDCYLPLTKTERNGIFDTRRKKQAPLHMYGTCVWDSLSLAGEKLFLVDFLWVVIPGVDVMITIFCDFCQFSAKILAFFSKTNVMIKFLQKLSVV